uniref:Zn(2)-C6 fungal-type domain-containing protein n=1 Tax=Bionectria ochroleuca TaxID=29856 RepID=A0A8H7K7C7_BIOOC
MSSQSAQEGDLPPDHGPAFRVRSQFGGARAWRSRKSRPCDACRRRKTACIIESAPPCLFCKTRDLPCESSSRHPVLRSRRRTRSQNQVSELPRADISAASCSPISRHSSDDDDDEEEEGSLSHPCPLPDEGQICPPPVAQHEPSLNICSDFATSPFNAVISPSQISSNNENATFHSGQSLSPAEAFKPRTHHTTVKPILAALDDEQRTGFHIGLSGEQDSNLLSSMRTIIVSEHHTVDGDIMQVFPGDFSRGEPPVHFNLVRDSLPSQDSILLQTASDAIEELIGERGPLLVSLYFKHVHPMNLVVCKANFLRAYAAMATSVPASLRGVIYGLGAMSWNRDPELRLLPSPSSHSLFRQAHSALQIEYHLPNQWTLQASLLLIHERPGDNFTMETPRTWILSSQSTAIAQMLGLHRDPKDWNIAAWEKRMRKKLWWSSYVTDIWSCVCHGNAPHINKDSFSTALVDVEEIAEEDEIDKDLQEQFLGPLDVSANVTARARSDEAYKRNLSNPSAGESKLLEIDAQLESWMLLRASCVGNASSTDPRDFSTNVKALLFRALMWPINVASKADPKSSLRRYFSKALGEFDRFLEFIMKIDAHSLNCFWGAHARSQLVLCGNFIVSLFLMAPTPDQVQATFRLLESTQSALKIWRELADNEDAISLLRPTLLRIDTLFTQAARMMDTGNI